MASDILYVSYNRLDFTRESFEALLANTDWDEVGVLAVADDGSTDGTADYLRDSLKRVPANIEFRSSQIGGPVAATNWYLDLATDAETFAKIDNDMVVCPGWLTELQRVMHLNPALDILGMEPFIDGGPTAPPFKERTITPARHIGGKGLIRKRAFRYCRPVAQGRLGFTAWQEQHEHVSKAWVTPDLPCFGLDQLPFEPWATLAAHYVDQGWQRHWPPYSPASHDYWSWWTPTAER